MSTDGLMIRIDKNSQTEESCANAPEVKTLNLLDLFKAKEPLIGENSKTVIPLQLSTNKSLSDTKSTPLKLSGYSELLAGFSIQDSNSNAKRQPSRLPKVSNKHEILPQIILDEP